MKLFNFTCTWNLKHAQKTSRYTRTKLKKHTHILTNKGITHVYSTQHKQSVRSDTANSKSKRWQFVVCPKTSVRNSCVYLIVKRILTVKGIIDKKMITLTENTSHGQTPFVINQIVFFTIKPMSIRLTAICVEVQV